MNNIGSIHELLGNLGKALDFFLKSLKIQISLFGEFHHSLIDTYNSIGQIYFKQQKFDEAHKIYKLTLEIASHHNQKNHYVAQTYLNLAETLYEQAKYAEAADNYEKALDLSISISPNDHSRISTAQKKLADAIEKSGNKLDVSKLGENRRTSIFATNLSIPQLSRINLSTSNLLSIPQLEK